MVKSEKWKGLTVRFSRHSGGLVVRAYSGNINKYDGKHKYYADGATKADAFKNFKKKYKK